MKKLVLVAALLGISWGIAQFIDVKLVLSWQRATYSKVSTKDEQCTLFVAGVYKSNFSQPFEECRAKWLLEGYHLKPDSEFELKIEL